MSDEEEKDCDCVPGLPAWMGTFADLMSLLMCFFVLLLSFAEIDVLKFKRLAGSMRNAFGVQNQVDVTSIPKGTSIIAQEFSPGKPDPTPLQVVMQQTTDSDHQTLEVLCEAQIEKAVAEACDESTENAQDKKAQISEFVAQKMMELEEEAETKAEEIAEKLQTEVAKDMVELETQGRKIIIRIQEKGAFSSGSAQLQDEFIPVLDKLIDILESIEGDIAVQGHTDDVPIQTVMFPSNWDLSVARALEVAHGLFDDGYLKQDRFSITGFADTRPLVPNDTPESRKRNRRVEIILQEKTDKQVKEELREESKTLDANSQAIDNFFELDPDEIF
ncbi:MULTISPECIES: flagellar motor protein MotB [unclassified Oleiphilus]|jgi:chemotaxis protein MotB|uniref:flagellar motor protein MotB n=2 Tax=Oleiphilus TaxID=141450 RepID=UPI0007C3F09E|nr:MULTISPECIES: flagellar motor protein MotB [unclassified Oleiphilus]KZY41454.1 flagellar motor protein MotB [Oleiphilus sp. HI0050]KZY84603.1 flagellar motor protein MotB [Oleiphilus sp. HI0068]KZY87350.1 flagellar motor protein MotB [Oleiphilus sp. HI0072]KZZ11526.1 flagellar motor protein MotB [Oleiphilus sp. HI0078]KZY38861.1 flagellar motor protein MotB [Oleiphilus sp. HI0043]